MNRTSSSRTAQTAKEKTRKTPLFPLEEAFLVLSSSEDVARFLLDLCTPAEIAAFRERWDIAQLVNQGMSYRDIAVRTGASTATITRVARFLQHERHRGYHHALEQLSDKDL